MERDILYISNKFHFVVDYRTEKLKTSNSDVVFFRLIVIIQRTVSQANS